MASRSDLKDSLEALRAELARGKPLDKAQRKRLDAALADVGRLLEGEEEHDHETLAERLGDAATHFEDSHPELTLAVGTLARILNRMGI